MTRPALLLLPTLALAVAGCGETDRARRNVRDQDLPAEITCRSYGEIVFQGRSTGRVRYSESGRLTFVNAADGRFTSVDGECVIAYARPRGNP